MSKICSECLPSRIFTEFCAYVATVRAAHQRRGCQNREPENHPQDTGESTRRQDQGRVGLAGNTKKVKIRLILKDFDCLCCQSSVFLKCICDYNRAVCMQVNTTASSASKRLDCASKSMH